MVAKGCTAAYDLYAEAPLPTLEGMDAVAEAYAALGMRAVLAPMVGDLSLWQAIPGLLDALPAGRRAEAERLAASPGHEILAALRGIAAAWRWHGQEIRLALGPTIPLHCTDAFLCGCRDLARERGLGLHMHVGESKVQAVEGMRRYGRTLAQHLDRLDLLSPAFTVAHAVWLDDDDLRLLADRGASVAHNPGSNMKLATGCSG